jgi:hypothetical protein
MTMNVIDYEIDGVKCDVFCYYEEYAPPTRFSPAEGEFFIDKVMVDNKLRDDLGEKLTQEDEDYFFKICSTEEDW